MSLAGCQIYPIDVNFHLQKKFGNFRWKISWQNLIKKGKVIKVSLQCQLGIKDPGKSLDSQGLFFHFQKFLANLATFWSKNSKSGNSEWSETKSRPINKPICRKEMVFCYQNCSDLLWEKIVLVIEKNFWNSRMKAENLQNFWDH